MLTTIPTRGLVPVLQDLGLEPEHVRPSGASHATSRPGERAALLCGIPAAVRDPRAIEAELAAARASSTDAGDHLLVFFEDERDERELARWRDALWPSHHVAAVYRLAPSGIVQRTLQGEKKLAGALGRRAELLVARPRAAVFARDAVAAKFDQNASGWNGVPGEKGYGHFRWMRRYVAEFAGDAGARAKRVLDFGCGAGWVGIEAGLRARGAEVSAFDPSPTMVELATSNARASGVERFVARVGFGEEPPFPAAGEAPFDLVLCSGVVSFSGDRARFLDGLVAAVAKGGTLVIGDLNRESKGMRARRAERPLLPLRELNAPTRDEVRAELEARGLILEDEAGYQLTSPVPELMHWSRRPMLGWLDGALLAWNRRSAGRGAPERFDSWVLRLRR